MSDTTLQSETEEVATPEVADVVEDPAMETEAIAPAAADPVDGSSGAESVIGDVEGADGDTTAPAAKPRKAPAKKTVKKAPAVEQAAAVEALVATVTTMSASVQSLSKTVDALSEKVVAPPVPHTVESSTVESSEGVETPEAETTPQKDESLFSIAMQCVGTLMSYVGVGLVAAAVMRNAFDAVALVMGLTGVVLYVANGMFVDRDQRVKGIAKYAINTAMTILGVAAIGLLVGGIQHFGSEPHRASVFVPLGSALFLVASAWKMRERLATEHLVWMAGAGVWVCLFLGLGLGVVANNIDPKPKSEVPATPATPAATDAHGAAATPAASGHGEAAPAAGAHGADVAPAAGAHGETTTPTTAAATHGDDHGTAAAPAATDGAHGEATPATTVAPSTDTHGGDAVKDAVIAADKAAISGGSAH